MTRPSRRSTPAASRSARGWRAPRAQQIGSRSRYHTMVASRQSSCGEVVQPSSRLALRLMNAQFSDEARISAALGIRNAGALAGRSHRQRHAAAAA